MIAQLRTHGHEVVSIRALGPRIPDPEVLRIAVERQAVLITSDKGFGELVFQRGQSHFGVILMRLEGIPLSAKWELLNVALDVVGVEVTPRFVVVTPRQLRVAYGPPAP